MVPYCGAAAASFGFLSSSEWFWGCREASKSGLSSSEWFWGCREASRVVYLLLVLVM